MGEAPCICDYPPPWSLLKNIVGVFDLYNKGFTGGRTDDFRGEKEREKRKVKEPKDGEKGKEKGKTEGDDFEKATGLHLDEGRS